MLGKQYVAYTEVHHFPPRIDRFPKPPATSSEPPATSCLNGGVHWHNTVGAMDGMLQSSEYAVATYSALPQYTALQHSNRGRTVRCARAVRALCEKLAVLHHREFGKFRRLKGRH